MPPLVSVVIPTWQRRDVVPAAIDSALAQTLRDLEVVVVDDGSTDGTAEALADRYASEPRVRVLRQENAGTAAARNRGLDEARGGFVAFLDSDDRHLPAFLARQVAALRAAPEADLALCDARYEGAWKRSWTTVLARLPPPRSLPDMVAGATAIPVTWLLRTEAARAVRFDPSWYIEDTEFLFRFFAQGRRVVVTEEVLAVYCRPASPPRGSAPAKSRATDRERYQHLLLQQRYAEHARDRGAHRVRLHRRWAKHCLESGHRRGAHAHAARWWRARPFDWKAGVTWLRSLGA